MRSKQTRSDANVITADSVRAETLIEVYRTQFSRSDQWDLRGQKDVQKVWRKTRRTRSSLWQIHIRFRRINNLTIRIFWIPKRLMIIADNMFITTNNELTCPTHCADGNFPESITNGEYVQQHLSLRMYENCQMWSCTTPWSVHERKTKGEEFKS